MKIFRILGFTKVYQSAKDGKPWRRFFVVVFLAALLITVFYSVRFFANVNPKVHLIGQEVLKYFPDDLEISVQNGEVFVNKEQPYKIKFHGFFDETLKEGDPENILVIDVSAKPSIDYFRTNDTFVMLAGNTLMIQSKNNSEVQLLPLGGFEDSVLEKDKVTDFFNSKLWLRISGLIPVMYIIGVLLFSFFRFLLLGLIAVVLVLILALIVSFFRKGQTRLLFMALPYAFTAGVVIDMVFFMIGYSLSLLTAPLVALIILLLNRLGGVGINRGEVDLPKKHLNGFESSQ